MAIRRSPLVPLDTPNLNRYQNLSGRASRLTGDYGFGYASGLRRHFYGENPDNPRNEARKTREDEWGRGYRDGLAGKEPVPLKGRPPLAADAPRSDKCPRTIRLGVDHWDKLRRLGIDWLERAIENASEPEKFTQR
jgi:hypothetical protein